MTILWCCHVRGPDDVYAAPDYETALEWADWTNSLNWCGPGRTLRAPVDFDDCLVKAVPAIWPGTPEEHAKYLQQNIAEWKPGDGRPHLGTWTPAKEARGVA